MKYADIIISLFFLMTGVIFVSDTAADTIYLKNGREITGTIILEADDYVKIDCMNTGLNVTYKKKYISKIEKDEPPLPEKDGEQFSLSAEQLEPDEIVQEQAYSANSTTLPQTIEEPRYIVYIPAGIDNNKRYPLVFMLDPGGSASAMIDLWRPIADKKKWILYGSKKFRNGISDWSEPEFAALKEISKKYPIDKRKVVTTGVSGGGMGAHMMSFFEPDLIRAVIPNVGRINPFFMEGEPKRAYPKNKLVVFLAGKSDFNYQWMRDDCEFLKDLGWRVKWIEFEGGHIAAPQESYEKAVDWLEKQW